MPAAPVSESINMSVNMNAWTSVFSASPIVQITLLILVGLSVVCWGIIYSKRRQFNLLATYNHIFLQKFWKANSLDEIFEHLDDHPGSNLARVFRAGYQELRKMAESNLATANAPKDAPPLLTGIDNLERALQKSVDLEIAMVESRMNVLATTGSTGPFIGLFGTVWGIMSSFQKIGATKMASLAVVAPGISEALIATAVGLAAAIPATVAYNHFVAKLKRLELDLNNFSADFLNIAKRNFFRDR
jgi:biopolymer transport protein TolQ